MKKGNDYKMANISVQEVSTVSVSDAEVLTPLNGKFIEMPYNTPFNNKGVRLVSIFMNMPLDLLKHVEIYQRSLETKRIATIEKMMTEAGGPWPNATAIINPGLFIVDGNHRITVMKKMGYTAFPIVHMMEFSSDETEAEFFVDVNKMNTQISADHYMWRARKLSKHPVGILLYKLVDEDEQSLLHDRVTIAERRSKHNKIPISSALKIISKCGLGLNQTFQSDREDSYINRINEVGYDAIRTNINQFMRWFIMCHGEKSSGHTAWLASAIRCYADLFSMLRSNNLLSTTAKYNQSVAKFRKFSLTKETLKLGYFPMMNILIGTYNKGKRNAQLRLPEIGV